MPNPEELLRKANEALMKANFEKQQTRLNEDRKFIISQIGKDLVGTLEPLLERISENSRLNRDEIYQAVSSAIGDTKIQVEQPDAPIVNVSVPDVIVPEIKAPSINIPPIRVPEVVMPDEMNVKGWVQLMGVDLRNPLPVQLRDPNGNPVNLFENLTQVISGGGGGFKTMTLGGILGSAWGELLNADNRLRFSGESGTAGLTDTELRASSVPVAQASGAVWSVYVPDSIYAHQVSGANWSVEVASQPTTFDIKQVSGSSDSVVVNDVLVSIGVNQVSGANWSVSVSESKAEDVAHVSGDTGFMALSVRNSTNTTFAADGDYQPIATDGVGRVITRPVQTRGLLQTAYVSMTTGTEATLLAGAAGTYFDLVYVMGTNNSDAAVTVDLRSATGGGIVTSIRIPANGTAGVSLGTPLPQDVAADTWTADMPDITGTTVTLGALFSREV